MNSERERSEPQGSLLLLYQMVILIEESQHPERELGTIGHIPVISEDIGILYASYLREVLTATANLEGVFGIDFEVTLCFAVLHIVRLRKTAYSKRLAQSADIHLGRSQRIEDVGILQIDLVRFGKLTYLFLFFLQ